MKGKYLYTCFVDFQKAYDSVWRDGLKYKLEHIGIKGKFLDIIHSMYKAPKISLLYKNQITSPFYTTVGLKQGDILSTIFFNLFINDLPSLLVDKNIPENIEIPKLGDTNINFLLFADDLAIFSLSQKGLQEKIDILEKYCKKWGLEINIKKTKIIVFNKQGANMKKFKFYYDGREIETARQYTYLGFTFIPSGKKHVGIENLLNKAKKAWFSIQKILHKSKEKTVDTYLKLIDSLIKPIILYACESWGDSLKKEFFANKIEKFHVSMYKQVLGVGKYVNNMKTLAEFGKTPLKINIETQMFKYFQRFVFLQENRYVFKAFQEEHSTREGWIQYMKTMLDFYGLGNLTQNIYKVRSGEIPKEKYKSKHKFFQKRVTDCYIQNQFYNYLDDENNKCFFTKIKQKHEKERYLSLKNFEIRQAISKLRLSSHKLAIVIGKWYKIEKENRICKSCDLNAIEDEFHFLIECPTYKDLRKSTFSSIRETENIDLSQGDINEKLKKLFSSGSLRSLHTLGKFIISAMKERKN